MRLCHWLPPVLLVKGKEPQVRVIIEVETTGATMVQLQERVEAKLARLQYRYPADLLAEGQLHVTAGPSPLLWHAKFVWTGK